MYPGHIQMNSQQYLFFFVQDNKNFCEEACSTNPVKNKHEEKPN